MGMVCIAEESRGGGLTLSCDVLEVEVILLLSLASYQVRGSFVSGVTDDNEDDTCR